MRSDSYGYDARTDEYHHPDGWEDARVKNLLLFAGATPDQKLDWLGHMLEIITQRDAADIQKGTKPGEQP